ncbi:MAG: hypothetical protein DCC49_04765 [Acidobacteria bacterium]|nr:MAG: hypothetical protein DCC49_04765 [Acidobacteriota bacterium]
MSVKGGYFIGETFQNIRRNFLMAASAILTVAISLALLGSVLLIRQWTDTIVGRWRGNVEINVFLRNDASEPQIQAVQSKISSIPDVKEFRYVSKEEALTEFQEMFKDKKDLVENVGPGVLPASFRITLKDPEEADAVGDQIKGLPGVDEVQYASQTIKRLTAITNWVTAGMAFFVAIFAIAAVLLIANTIRLAVFARRKEIGIMKLVGATNWFVRVPFMLEGLLTGFIGSVLAFAGIYGLAMLTRRVQSLAPIFDAAVGTGAAIETGLILVVFGIGVGILGSGIALRRFLDV